MYKFLTTLVLFILDCGQINVLYVIKYLIHFHAGFNAIIHIHVCFMTIIKNEVYTVQNNKN